MTREDLENKGWKLWEAAGNVYTYTKGNPYAQECIWLVYDQSRLPNIEVRFSDSIKVEGWLIKKEADELHWILEWIVKKDNK